MKILFSHYELKKKTKLNSVDKSAVQCGVLLKVVEADFWGVADLCVKPELGDPSIDSEIRNKGDLFLRAIELAEEDLSARREGKSLLQDKWIKNNILITDYKNTNLNQDRFFKQTLKIKGDHDVSRLSELLNELKISCTLRLDFNSCLNSEEFEKFLRQLSEDTLKKIEYIEDPTPISRLWKKWNEKVPLAFDFQKSHFNTENSVFHVIKPSRQKLPESLNHVTLTSAMEHPVGFAHGLRIAQNSAKNVSGFSILDLYERTGFEKYFVQKENSSNFSNLAVNDVGIGMTNDLNLLSWGEL